MRAEYPARPIPAAGAIVLRGDDILMVKRAAPPEAGRWSIPGGAVEWGETAEAAVVREVLEETGVRVRPLRVAAAADILERSPDGRVRFHYASADFLCEHVDGEPVPASDALNARWIPVRELHEYDVTETALAVIREALRGAGHEGA